jgi:hypothetical protein
MSPYDEERNGPPLETDIDVVEEGPDIEYASVKDTKYSWVVCFAGFSLQVIVVGFLHVFGIFFINFVEEFGTTKAKTGAYNSAKWKYGALISILSSVQSM